MAGAVARQVNGFYGGLDYPQPGPDGHQQHFQLERVAVSPHFQQPGEKRPRDAAQPGLRVAYGLAGESPEDNARYGVPEKAARALSL